SLELMTPVDYILRESKNCNMWWTHTRNCNQQNAGLFLFVASLLAFIGPHSRMYCGYAFYSPVYYLPVSHPAAGGTRQPAAA
ncbi:hypothetical protein ELM60_26420, partial [Klebsiella pneumoniae]|nr:hypothetical protein [Klebsiella pneumoniae]MBL1697079.1 hypothetical protein [Klebsiella pneumoniae]MBL1816064.1 hypothetical protein [Klebsiella pneumoniae]MBL1850217.1 hypothetical protein [Klebsiella pneumoniae]MBL1892735.1 hypothetical protein [Klebsiella pneumoniae]